MSGLSHLEVVEKIRQDCIDACSHIVGRITFDGEGEEEVVKGILEYNYDMEDIKHMQKIEKVNLFLHLQQLKEHLS